MPSLLVIRLHPIEPIEGDAFTSYLDGLSITAHEVSYANPTGADAAFAPIGTATCIAPTLPSSPGNVQPIPVQDANTRIVQHFAIAPFGIGDWQRVFAAAATAVIEIPDAPAGGEYKTADIRITIQRNGVAIVHKPLYYNVPVAPAPLPANPNDYQLLSDVSFQLALPSGSQGGGAASLLPDDGTAPNFNDLRTAVEGVLNLEPGNSAGIAGLSKAQCRHIAYEIVWDRVAYPLPLPKRSFEELYTGPQAADSDDERDRLVFEGELLTYYTKHNTQAEHLANFVYSLSAALWCEQQSQQAPRVGFEFPPLPGGNARPAKVILRPAGAGALSPAFAVPAAYFYALTSVLPPQVSAQQRFDMVRLDATAQTVINLTAAVEDNVITEPAGINRFQAARRLRALGLVGEAGTPECVVTPATDLHTLLTDWLAFAAEDIDTFWATAFTASRRAGHLALVLCAVTMAHQPLIDAIDAPAFGVDGANDLSAKTQGDWNALLLPPPAVPALELLPPFTKPGVREERVQAFLRYLRRFFDIADVSTISPVAMADEAPLLYRPPGNPIDELLAAYPGGFLFSGWNDATLQTTLDAILPGDEATQKQLTDWLSCVKTMVDLSAGIAPDELRFSVMEALWARGITSIEIVDRFTPAQFKDALAGTVAWVFSDLIWENAGVDGPDSEASSTGFQPINPDGSLVNCVPPAHRSPFGPVAYLHDLLRASAESTCNDPTPDETKAPTLAVLLSARRGPVDELLATRANLEVPLPLIDLVNESLEHMAATGDNFGAVFNTARDTLGGHVLNSSEQPDDGSPRHDPITLFEALPEHSTPAVPAEAQAAYDKLAADFSACHLPYSQRLDVSRSYLRQLGSSRFATMRRFRRDITELVIDPAGEPADFQRQLWRYPVRLETALEYLGVSPEEHTTLFSGAAFTLAQVQAWYGFTPTTTGAAGWLNIVLRLDNFLDRTCLSYCEFVALWKSGLIEFDAFFGERQRNLDDFPDCPPCCLDGIWIRFPGGTDSVVALGQLFVFIRLWRKLQANLHSSAAARYSFAVLRDIAEVLQLFIGNNVNSEFIRQLAAFQMLRDEFQLALTDGSAAAAGATAAQRTHLLAMWVPGDPRNAWAVQHLLDQIQQYARRVHDCGCREPEFLKLLSDNLDTLSMLAGFDPSTPADAWQAHPTHSLRLAEVLAKIYASEFRVGELLFLFTTEPHLQGDDPFALQTINEAKDQTLSLPDDENETSLLSLRHKLLCVEVDAEAASAWSWDRIDTTLRMEFGYQPIGAEQPLLELGAHFFPHHLNNPASPSERRYTAALPAGSSEPMWNTPPDGPFRYDALTKTLSAELPLIDTAVLAKLARIRALTPPEQQAVRDLYYQPRRDLAQFSYLFDNFTEAEQRLIQEPDEAQRWAWFQHQFELFFQRSRLIAEHLAMHTGEAVSRCADDHTNALARLLLKHLRADENHTNAPWENDNGHVPAPRWGSTNNPPNGGACAALLGLRGTGIRAEFTDASGTLVWRELRGGLLGFGEAGNACNSPVPTLVPSMAFTLSATQLRSAGIRNGFAMANADGSAIGGAEPFRVSWHGQVLIDCDGDYAFAAGAPTGERELPSFDGLEASHRWRVLLRRGQKTWVLLAHDWQGEEAPSHCAEAIALKRGFYTIEIELDRKPLAFEDVEDRCRQTTGWQLKFNGPDSHGHWHTIPYNKLFESRKDTDLADGLKQLGGAALEFLGARYTSTLRDIRRTYQRAFKALLLVERFDLSAQPVADDGQSELGYILANPERFAGQSYYRSGGVQTHRALFDFNFLPLLDNYFAPTPAQDQRAAPSVKRMQALFDSWERLFDYTRMRHGAARAPESPAWLLFHEAAEAHTDSPAHLLRHLGIDLRHAPLLLAYFDATQADLSYDLTSDDLADDRWAVRVWHAERCIRALLQRFFPEDLPLALPYLWASDGPTLDGNANLTAFYRNGCIENGEPRRYLEVKKLNDGLRVRGRDALVAYLTHMNRVALPGGGFATEARQLSHLLLIDVEAGACQKASRVEDLASAAQQLVLHARLGDDATLQITPDFVSAWERHFASFRVWEACARRTLYRENWVEWDELHLAQRSEAFQFLQTELKRSTLTAPVPGGLAYWNGPRLPSRPGLGLLQHREPSVIETLQPSVEGLGLLGLPDRHARPSWLAPLHTGGGTPGGPHPSDPTNPHNPDNPNGGPLGVVNRINEAAAAAAAAAPPSTRNANGALPLWFQAAVRLGRRFVRVAAAALPAASTTLEGHCGDTLGTGCCAPCCSTTEALVDEYYFWIEDGRAFDAQVQDAAWGAAADDPQTDWHRPEMLPTLLDWKSQTTVHLHWSRLHDGEFDPPRRSSEGVRLQPGAEAGLSFTGRSADSLQFAVVHGVAPVGLAATPPAGFRYDIATDSAIVLPEVVAAPVPPLIGGLAAFPFFAWFSPGAPLLPVSSLAVSLAVAGHLRAHCRFEAALKWYELSYVPLLEDNRWTDCAEDDVDVDGSDDGGDDNPTGNPTGNPNGNPNGNNVPGIALNVPDRGNDLHVTRNTNAAARFRGRVGLGACCCASDPVPEAELRERAVLLHYLEAVLQWSQAQMRLNTPEAFQKARLLVDMAARIAGQLPKTVITEVDDDDAPAVIDLEPSCAPLNPRLMCVYTAIEDRTALIHACLNAKRRHNGRPTLDMPYFGDSEVRGCWKTEQESCVDLSELCVPKSCYRFTVLLQKAQELTGEVRSLSALLLSACEKGDAEYLVSLRGTHEVQLLRLGLEVRESQWRAADWQVQALQKTKQMSQTRLHYYRDLVANGLISGEVQYEPLTISASTVRTAGNVSVAIGQVMNLIPDPFVGFPVNGVTLPPGSKLSSIFGAAGTIASTVAEILNAAAALGLTKAGWVRREDEWQQQIDVLTVEIEQIERQILAAERQRDSSLRELNNHQRTLENASEVQDFLRDKFTNHARFLWMYQQAAASCAQMYELALPAALQAQAAFNNERGFTTRRFIDTNSWDSLHEGLMAGERLGLSLRQMEKAYYDENCRDYELTKHFSLRLLFPVDFLRLRLTGACEIDIPEWLFDMDYPGHYMRRIKNVKLNIPCVTGPYTGVHCKLTLISCTTRIDPSLHASESTCCDTPADGPYALRPDDPRAVKQYQATEAIATSSGQQDGGVFELNFRDERYLPFEFAGAVSRWRIEMPKENNFFDMDSLANAVMSMDYISREGGDLLRRAAGEAARKRLPGDGRRMLDMKRELPDAWTLFDAKGHEPHAVRLKLSRSMFPYLPGKRAVDIHRIGLLIETEGATPSARYMVKFIDNEGRHYREGRFGDCDSRDLVCLASEEWPCLFHGELDVSLHSLSGDETCEVGTLIFPTHCGAVSKAFLFCDYTARSESSCSPEHGATSDMVSRAGHH